MNRVQNAAAAVLLLLLVLAACGPSVEGTPAAYTSTPIPTTEPSATPTVTATPAPEPTATVIATPEPSPEPALIEAQVVEVVDGDTIRVSIDGEVYPLRFIGIDAPETDHPAVGQERLGQEALEANRALVEGQTVYLEYDVSPTDQYGRILAYVYLPDGRMVNEELVRLGLAVAQAYPPDTKHQDRLYAAEIGARSETINIWEPQATVQPQGARVVITEHRGGSNPEYIGVANEGDVEADLSGWWLLSVRGNQVYHFPAGYVLPPGATVRVYSGPEAEANPEDGLLWTTDYMWNNREPDAAELYNAQGELVSERGG